MKDKIKTTPFERSAPKEKGGKLITLSSSQEDCDIGILKIKEIIDGTTNEIFLSYRHVLLNEPITYLIAAVWGEINDGRLTPIQKEIDMKITRIVDRILGIVELEDRDEAREFIMGYLIRGLVISKIIYMIEAFKNRKDLPLTHIEPMGNA